MSFLVRSIINMRHSVRSPIACFLPACSVHSLWVIPCHCSSIHRTFPVNSRSTISTCSPVGSLVTFLMYFPCTCFVIRFLVSSTMRNIVRRVIGSRWVPSYFQSAFAVGFLMPLLVRYTVRFFVHFWLPVVSPMSSFANTS